MYENAGDEETNEQFGVSFTHLPARSRRSDSRSAGAAGSDADCREGSAGAAVDREME